MLVSARACFAMTRMVKTDKEKTHRDAIPDWSAMAKATAVPHTVLIVSVTGIDLCIMNADMMQQYLCSRKGQNKSGEGTTTGWPTD